MLLSLPSADYIFLQPITPCCPVTHTPTEGRLLAVALLSKSTVTREHLCAAISTAPMTRPERRRTLPAIAKGCDIVMLGADADDEQATARMLREIDRAPLPA